MNYQRINYPNGYKKVLSPRNNSPTQQIPQMPLPTPRNNLNQPKLNLFPIDEGYLKGTIYQGLFRPYKNMSPERPALIDDKERLLFNVGKYHFGMVELGYYLNNFPNDIEALRIFNNFRTGYLKAKEDYENRFGALDWSSQQLEREPWNWVQTLAPWKKGV